MKKLNLLFVIMLLASCGDEQPNKKALEELRDRAATSDKLAQYALGVLYARGESGVKQDYDKAGVWLKLAAGQGLAEAQFELGKLYVEGAGVKKDYKKGMEWFLKAANQNNAKAQFNLGRIYEKGQVGEVNYNEAKRWYDRAVSLGDGNAAYNLGNMYLNGKGVQQNRIYAHIWFDLATKLGIAESAKERDKLTPKMTIDELENSDRQSSSLFKQLQERGAIE